MVFNTRKSNERLICEDTMKIFYIPNENSILNDINDDSYVIDNFTGLSIKNRTVFQPLQKLSKQNIILWTIMNGFNIFKFDNEMIISFLCKPIEDNTLRQIRFILDFEKTRLGCISLVKKVIGSSIFYRRCSAIDENLFLITRAFANDLIDQHKDDDIFGDDIKLDFTDEKFSIYELLS